MKAVIWTDCVQVCILIFGMALIGIMGIHDVEVGASRRADIIWLMHATFLYKHVK